jgi:hypothetical protein
LFKLFYVMCQWCGVMLLILLIEISVLADPFRDQAGCETADNPRAAGATRV